MKTEYVITLDKIKEYAGEEFLQGILDEVLRNKEQLREWEELGFGKVEGKDDLFSKGEYKKLPIDTKYFSLEFKERLLEKLTEERDLDDILDGLLIKSENWQALNTILGKYREKVQTIYIDPPFNKEQDADYLYNVKYKDSTWASILENRLRLARDLLNERGSIFVRCDYNGNWIVRPLMDEIFGKDTYCNEITLGRTPGKKRTGSSLSYTKDYLLFYGKTLSNIIKEFWKETEDYILFTHIITILEKEKNISIERIKTFLEENLFWVDLDHRPGERKENRTRTLMGIEFEPPKGRHWIKSQDKLDELYKNGKARIKCKNCGSVFYSEKEVNPKCCSNKKWTIQ
ncbi:MAG: DNA methyltransferase, partial [bacterium]